MRSVTDNRVITDSYYFREKNFGNVASQMERKTSTNRR